MQQTRLEIDQMNPTLLGKSFSSYVTVHFKIALSNVVTSSVKSNWFFFCCAFITLQFSTLQFFFYFICYKKS